MLRFWKKLNELYGWFVIIAFGLVMLIGMWQVYDNYYLFSHTIDSSVLRYKPVKRDEPALEEQPVIAGMVAWITIEDTNIDYPVMQGKDNNYYLNTDPFGNYSLTGSIFLDSRSSPDFSDEYSVIYGHHMDYGKMFGALDDFLDEAYLKEHSKGTLIVGDNADNAYDIEIFASMKVSAKEKTVFDMKQDGIRQFIRGNASVMTHEKDSRIIALSTCVDADSLDRVAVFGYISKE